MDAFLFQLRSLFRDRAFILSAGFSVLSTVIFVFTAMYILGMGKINITKIAEVSSLDLNVNFDESSSNVKPISGIFKLANIDLSSSRVDSEIPTLKSQIWHGYLVKLDAFCQIGNDLKDNLNVGI
jgi:hypothetical protein